MDKLYKDWGPYLWFLLKTSTTDEWLSTLKLLDTHRYRKDISYNVFKENSAITTAMIPDIILFVRDSVSRGDFSKTTMGNYLREEVAKKTIRWYLYHKRDKDDGCSDLWPHITWGMCSVRCVSYAPLPGTSVGRLRCTRTPDPAFNSYPFHQQ